MLHRFFYPELPFNSLFLIRYNSLTLYYRSYGQLVTKKHIYKQIQQVNELHKHCLQNNQKELDPTTTSTYAADLANVFEGVNKAIPVMGFNYRQFAVADYRRDHPRQARSRP